MRFHELLREYTEPQLVQLFGGKALAHFKQEFPNKKTTTPDQLVSAITKLDPSPDKKYSFWLLGNYARYSPANADNQVRGIARYEDIGSRAVPALKLFDKLVRTGKIPPESRDINRLKSLSQLEDVVGPFVEKVKPESNKELADATEQAFYTSGEAELVYNSAQVKVVIPKTEEASCYFGVNTRWCTAGQKNNRFEYYNKDGPLYIILIKAANKRYQFHFADGGQFMDEQDKEINPQELANKYPILWQIFGPISKAAKSIVLQKNPSEAVQMAAVQNNGYAIRFIKNPSEAVQMATVQQNGYAIQYIKNPSEAMQMAAVRQDGFAIKFIKNPSEAMQLAAVRNNGCAIYYIETPSEAMQMAAVQQNGYAIQYIKNPSEAVQIAAVRQDGLAIRFIKNPSEAVQLAAVKKNGNVIEFIKNPSEAVQMAAVQQDGHAIGFIKNPSEAMQMAAVQQTGYAIKYIKNPSPKVMAYLAKNR